MAINMLIERGDSLLALEGMRNLSNYGGIGWQWTDLLKHELETKAVLHAIPASYRPDSETESLEAAIKLAISKMSEDGDWAELWELLSVVQNRFHNLIPGVSEGIRAISAYFEARRFERAGRLAAAIREYVNVLESSGPFGPIEEAEAAVRRLREEEGEALLADQKREAEIPRAQRVPYDPRSRYGHPLAGRGMDSRQLEEQIERAVAKEFAAFLERESKKELEAIKKEAKEKEEKSEPAAAGGGSQ